jgi:CheY-like chemotaxis protein
VSLPHLLVVDDSEAILAYEAAALSSSYTLSTASNGIEALDKLGEIRPAAVLLDLSMPQMSGDELLVRMQADPGLRSIPVIVVSSEKRRGEASLKRGARAFLPKPIRAPELRALVASVLDDERRRAQSEELAVLVLGLGALDFGIPLDPVREVLPYPMTRVVPLGPEYLAEMIDYRGSPVLVLDLARRLGIAHAEPVQERKLVVWGVGDRMLAISVDRVREPQVFAPGDVLPRVRIAGVEHALLSQVLLAIVKTDAGPVPVLEPKAFLTGELLDAVSEVLGDSQTGWGQP